MKIRRESGSSPRWLGPAVWGLVVVCVFAAYFALVRESLLRAQERDVAVDAELLAESARLHLETDLNYLVMLARERGRGFLDAASFRERGSRYVADHPQLICINWVEADFVITDVAPLAGNEQIVGLPLYLPEPGRVSRLAVAERRPVYTRPFDVIQGDHAFELWVPVFEGDDFVGLLGGVYSYEKLLQVVTGPDVRRRNRVSVADSDGRVFLELPSEDVVAQKLAQSVAFTPAENGTFLVVTPYVRGLTNRTMRVLEVLCLGLVMGAGFFMWRLRREVEARRRTGKALRDSEARARSVLDNVAVGVAVISPRMEVLDANPVMLAWFPGLDPARRPFCYHRLCDPPRDSICDNCPTARALRDGRVHEATKTAQRDGVTRSYQVVSSPVIGEGGAVTAAVEIVEDVTERLAAEAQSLQAQKMEAVGRLAGGVAHDFNNMLQVIIGNTELALDELEPGHPCGEPVREIGNAAERSAKLVSQLLAFARKQVTTPRRLDLNRTIEGTIGLLQRLIGENIDLAWRPGPDVWPVRLDPAQLDQVLANLCVNARDAITGTGHIVIETGVGTYDEAWCAANPGFQPGEYALLTVSDDGSGMDRETLSRLFEPFYTTKALGRGTGLGLATVYGIVSQNGGYIRVDSEPGHGTAFRLYLPRYAESDDAPPAREPAAPPARGREVLLLVEDEPLILDMGRSALERLGYRVLSAASPAEAFELTDGIDDTVDLLITDVVMPGMNGRELSERLAGRYPGLRTLFISGYSGDIIADHGVLGAGVHFLQKPFTIHELATAVRGMLDPAH